MRVDKILPPLRDVVCLGLGTYGFIWQVTHGADLVLMGGCILVLCGPVVMGAWALRGNTPANGSSSASAAAAPLPPSPSPSSSAAGE